MKTFFIPGLLLALFAAACGAIPDEPPDMQVLRESRPLGDIKPIAVTVDYDVGTLEVSRSMDADLFTLDLEYDRRRSTPKFNFDGDSLAIELSRITSDSGFSRNNHLALKLSGKVPLDLDIASGVAESRLDLGGLELTSLKLEGGVGRTEVTFDKPTVAPMREITVQSGVGELIIRSLGNSRAERLNFEGGVGRTEIDFTGDLGTASMTAAIEVGVGHVKLLLPREADIEIHAEGGFLSNVSAPSFEQVGNRGETFTHASGSPDSPKIVIRIESGIGGVAVELR